MVLSALQTMPAGGGGIPTLIQDADADTRVEVEQAADEDFVRITCAGVERAIFRNVVVAGNEAKLVGLVEIDNLGANVGPSTAAAVQARSPATSFSTGSWTTLNLLSSPNFLMTGGSNRMATGLLGAQQVQFDDTTTGHQIWGLNFSSIARVSGAGTVIDNMFGVDVINGSIIFQGIINNCYGLRVQPFSVFIAGALTTNYGVRLMDMGGATVTDAYGLLIDDISGNSGFRRILELGGTIGTLPNLRLEANAPTNPGVDKGRSRVLATFNENGVNALRRCEWKLQSTLVAGDRVMVAV